MWFSGSPRIGSSHSPNKIYTRRLRFKIGPDGVRVDWIWRLLRGRIHILRSWYPAERDGHHRALYQSCRYYRWCRQSDRQRHEITNRRLHVQEAASIVVFDKARFLSTTPVSDTESSESSFLVPACRVLMSLGIHLTIMVLILPFLKHSNILPVFQTNRSSLPSSARRGIAQYNAFRNGRFMNGAVCNCMQMYPSNESFAAILTFLTNARNT